MVNRYLYLRDPIDTELLNNGVAEVSSTHTLAQLQTLRWELKTFVCEGEYAKGFDKIISTYLNNLDKPEQPAVWVSGFYGSGKSHLVKMLRYLWEDFEFPADTARARGIAQLPKDIQDRLKELTTSGKRFGGLCAISGKLGAGAADSVRLSLLSVIFSSLGLPENYPSAKLVLWLKKNGKLDEVKNHLKEAKREFDYELNNMYVSPHLAKALLAVDPQFASSEAVAKEQLRAQYPPREDVTTSELLTTIRETLTTNGKLPCTLIVLDEVQQYIGENTDRSFRIQEVVEACSKQLDGKVMIVGTGQSALTGTPVLERLIDRFRVQVHLSDKDVETVTREIVLKKKPEYEPSIKDVLSKCQGEISRHLAETKLGHRTEDNEIYVQDYPILPVRRRFWEKVLRALDVGGKESQLRSQLRIVLDAVKATANSKLGSVIPADLIYSQLSDRLVQTGALPREIYERIATLKENSDNGELRARLCELIFLIGKLPREGGSDTGVRANAEMLADLLVEDLVEGSTELRSNIPEQLEKLVMEGILMPVETEYRIQTREGVAWDNEYRQNNRRIQEDGQLIADTRSDLLRRACGEKLKGISLTQGNTRTPRKIEQYFVEPPAQTGQAVPIWIRDGWTDTVDAVQADARRAGSESPLVYVWIPNRSGEDLKKAIANWKAAQQTLQHRGNPTGDEATQARLSIETREREAKIRVDNIINDIVEAARILLAGGSEAGIGVELRDRVKEAADAALSRMYPNFSTGDDTKWEQVINQARQGSAAPLDALRYSGNAENHPVCAEILRFIGTGKKGSEIRKQFMGNTFGWPQDAVDGGLLALMAAGLVRATQNGSPIERKHLDRTSIGVADFKTEQVVITTPQRLALRGLFQSAGVKCIPNEELTAAGEFLKKMSELAEKAGGDAPLPVRPNTKHLEEMNRLSGSELLSAIHEAIKQFEEEFKAWTQQADLASKRWSRWELLQKLLKHADGLEATSEVARQNKAILDNRSLLSGSDPVPALCTQITDALRSALVKVHGDCKKLYDEGLRKLNESEVGKKLTPEQRQTLLEKHGLLSISDIKVGSEPELMESLDKISLSGWKTLCEALPQRFNNLIEDAVKLLLPTATKFTPPSATFNSAQDVDEWMAKVKQAILEQLKNGPVII